MKKLKYLVLLLVCILPIQVFAATSEADAEALLKRLGLTPDSELNKGKPYLSIYENEEGYNEYYKLYNTSLNITSSDTTQVLCDELYDGKEIIQLGDFYAYKVDEGRICYKWDTTKVISYDKFNPLYKSLYGENAPKKDFGLYNYHETRNSYVALDSYANGSVGGDMVVGNVFKIVDLKETDNDLKVKVAYETIKLENNKLIIGNQEFKEDKDIKEIQDEMIKNHINEIDHYVITLVKKDNNYVFSSLAIAEEEVEVPDTAAFIPYAIYIIGIILIGTGIALWISVKNKQQKFSQDI